MNCYLQVNSEQNMLVGKNYFIESKMNRKYEKLPKSTILLVKRND